MKLDLSCPIEVRGYSMRRGDGCAEATVRLYNLSDRRIAAFEAVAKWHDSTSGRSLATPFVAERLRVGGENGFKVDLTTDRLPDADALDLLFTRVRFEDGSPDWRCGDGPFAELEPLPAIDAETLDLLRSEAGSDAVCFPEQRAQIWRCICGRLNPNAAGQCARCHRVRAIALGFTPDSLHDSAKQSAAVADDLAALHADYLRQRKRLFRRTMLASVAVLALTICLVLGLENGKNAQPTTESVSAEP